MNQLPDFWREEVWHPLTVHLPLTALILATLFFIVSLLYKKKYDIFTEMSAVLLVIGTIGAWISIYTGNIADGIVSRELCDPTVMEAHERFAYTSTWIFTAASLLTGLYYFLKSAVTIKIVRAFILILIITGSGFLISVGHKGATLVYQQAAGVYVPSEDCSEFSD